MSIKRTRITFVGIILVAILAGLVAWPKGPDLNLKPLGIDYQKELKIQEGLDLEGGSSLNYQADLSQVKPKDREEALNGLVQTIEDRITQENLVGEPLVQPNRSGGQERVIVELPGITDVEKAAALIGRTAKLEFWEPLGPKEKQTDKNPLIKKQGLSEYKRTSLSGADLSDASAGYSQETGSAGEVQINLTFKSEGAKQFAAISRRNVGKIVPITIDAGLEGGRIISPSRIQEEITGGQATISGGFTIESAKELAKQLNSGALPVPVKLVEQRTVGPSLGQDSVQKSLAAGLLGLALVALFMISYYRLPGLLAVGALLLYSTVMVAIFKLAGITQTLAGIGGFILSIGIAVDANILIFERMREELRGGKTLRTAVEVGFERAFTSIRDSNMASILMSVVLFTVGQSPTIKTFAVVLALGVIVSLFSAITVTRTLMRLAVRTRLANRPGLWDVVPKSGKRATSRKGSNA